MERDLAFFCPSLAKAHSAKALLEEWSGQVYPELREEALVDQMREASLAEESLPLAAKLGDWLGGSATPKPEPSSVTRTDRGRRSSISALASADQPTLSGPKTSCDWPALSERELSKRGSTPHAAWLDRKTTLEVTFRSPTRAQLLAFPSKVIDALDLANIHYRRPRALCADSLYPMGKRESAASKGRGHHDVQISSLQGIAKGKRAARRLKGRHSWNEAHARLRRQLPLRFCGEAEAAARVSRQALLDSALVGQFNAGCTL